MTFFSLFFAICFIVFFSFFLSVVYSIRYNQGNFFLLVKKSQFFVKI